MADMQKLSDVDKLVEEVSSKEKALHVLVNNAGAAWGDNIDAYPVRPIPQVSPTVVEFLVVGLLGPGLDQSLDVEPSPGVHSHPEMLAAPSSCRKRGWKKW